MHASRRLTVVVTAVVTAVIIGVAGAILLAVDAVPAPSIAPMASADTADGGGFEDPWAAHQQRCGPVLEDAWGPSEAELAEIREENERIMAALDDAGVEYRLATEENGFEYVEPVDGDYEAFERVLEDFWGEHEEGMPSEEHLAEVREQNEALAAHLDEQGVEYEIVAEPDGWEHVEPRGESGWQVMEAFWHEQEREDLRQRAEERGLDVELTVSCFDEERELSGMFDGFDPFPLPMDMRMASEQKALVEDLITAFDEAGIDYQRLDVPFLQWDRSDEEAAEIIERIAGEHGWGHEMEPDMMVEEVVVEDGMEESG